MPLALTSQNQNYIILTRNKINNTNEGTKILIHTPVITRELNINTNTYYL